MEFTAQKTYPRFMPKDKTTFFPTLQKRVNGYFKENNITRFANRKMIVKTVVLILSFIIPVLIVNILVLKPWAIMLLYTLMGFAFAGIGMSVMHDANHGAYSKNSRVNTLLGYTLNLIGGIVSNWKVQHNVLHHTYTNVHGHDDDIADKLILRLCPHSEVKKVHRFQLLYAFFFYSLITLYWATVKDFQQFFRYQKEGTTRLSKAESAKALVKMALLKLFFFAYMVIIPIVVTGNSAGLIIGGFLLMHAIGGLLLGIVFQLAHSVEEADFPLPNDANIIENEWAMHQMRTTVNFAPDNKLLSWYVGGLNYQVEHHLFPNICHVHYPEISKIVEETAKEFGVPYLITPSLGKAFMSHLEMLRKFGYSYELDLARM